MIYFCVPVYNEEETIGITLYKIKEVMEGLRGNYTIIALDDGSTDGTWETMRMYEKLLPITTVRNRENMGLGYSLKKLIQVVTDDSKYPERDVMITAESDFTSDTSTVPSMMRAIEEGADVVIASGYARGGEVISAPLKVRFTSILLHLLLRNLYAIEGVRDYLSMLRAYRIVLLKKFMVEYGDGILDFRTKAANTQLLIHMAGIARRIAEVPCTQRYDVRKRQSRIRLIELFTNHVRLVSQHWSDREV